MRLNALIDAGTLAIIQLCKSYGCYKSLVVRLLIESNLLAISLYA